MRKTAFLLSLLLLLVMAPGASAEDSISPIEPLVPLPWLEAGEPTVEATDLWFVELASPPVADGGQLVDVRMDKTNFRAAAARAGLRYSERFAFDTLWNGLSIQIEPSELLKLTRVSGVKALYPVARVPIPETTPVFGPELATALAMTGANVAQTELGLSGAGIRVAVMDTGIDYNHPDLGDCSFLEDEDCRVATGWDFVGDDFNAGSPDPARRIPVPDEDPLDCQGHGTHVAGIIGASGTVTGVAPGVTFGAYRVFGCEGSTFADIMLAAMEMALEDEMDVLNMSIGSAFQWPQYPTAAASDRLVSKGMVVVASIGNSATYGVYSSSAPGVGHKVIGVASVDNSHVALRTFTISPDDMSIGYGVAAAAPLPPTSGTFPMARTGTATSTADACTALPAGSLTGKVVLIRRGTCTFHTKSLNAQNAGAVAVVLYNNVAGRFSPTVAGTPPITIPVVAISDVEGVLINGRLAAGPVDMTWTDQLGIFLNPTGGLTSSFSSYGLSPDLDLKPDIAAPGGLIRSTYPLAKGSYATLSGTSMSSPHVAGAVALLLEARPSTPAQVVRDILQNSADPYVWWGNPGLGFLDNVHRQGAGMLDIPGAVMSMTRIEPAKLSLGESEPGPAPRTLTIRNTGPSEVTYSLSHAPALSTAGSTYSPSFFTGFASVSFSGSTVTVPAGGMATVDVTVTANPALLDGAQYGGYVVFTPLSGGPVYKVPYAGFKGDYQSIPALVPTSMGFPWLAKLVDSTYVNKPEGATFTMMEGDIPYIIVHLDHQVRRLRAEVFDANTGRSWYRAFEFQYVGRNSEATSFFALPWDGLTTAGRRVYTLPDGSYVIKLSVQKALGEDDNPAHWESWSSPVITISRG